jgi:hypothetical protein
MLLGGAMVLTAMLLVELAPRRKVEGQGVSPDSMACCAPPCGHLAALSSVVDAGASPPSSALRGTPQDDARDGRESRDTP